jgi:hypothetical protein
MARGWESKAVADQIEEGNQPRGPQAPELTPEQRLKQERLASLLLSRARLLDQLERATQPAHRNMLLNGLKAIEKEIENIQVG